MLGLCRNALVVLLWCQDRFSEEKWKSRFNKTAKENYHRMGLLSLSVVFYTLKNGQQAVDMYVYFNSFYCDNTALTTSVMKTFQSYWVSLASNSGKCMNQRLLKLCEQ